MILTGNEIRKRVHNGDVTIEPFEENQLNPNSYNYRLGSKLGVPIVTDGKVEFEFIEIPVEGYMLEPGQMYLGHTFEVLGSRTFAMSLIGRSSLGRLGLYLQVSADLGHTGSCHQWTLEIVSIKKMIIYSGMKIGQISFWVNKGSVGLYQGGYSDYDTPQVSKFSFN